MPDKRKKKTREDAIELLKQKAANNGLKNQAQLGARTLKLNTTTEKDNVYTTPKSTSTQTTNSTRNGQNNRKPQTVNSSTTPRKSTTGTLTGSQSPSATDRLFKETAKRYTRGNDITARRQRYSEQTDSRNKKTVTTSTVRRNSRGQEVSGRDRTRSAVNTPTKPVLRKDTGKWAKNEAWGALTGFNADIASTVDFLLPDVITPKAVQKGLDYYRNANESQQQKVQALRNGSLSREIIGNIGVNAIQQIPSATMAFLTGGTSIAAQAAPTLLNPSTLTHTGNVVTRALGQVARDTGRNPMFWETFLRTAGNTYDNEVKNGASPVRATLSAYANGLLNAQIEVGGGVELYDPSETFLKAIARSAKEEGLEEVQQYAVENLVNKAIGSNTSKWFSMQRGDNAVVNPVDMLEQGAYGAIGGGLAAGGRVAMAKTMSNIADTRYANALPDIQAHAQNLINRALVQGREGERTSNSERLALTMQEQMDRGMQIPTRQVMELENALRTDEAYNAQDYERRNRERYQQAVSEGRADTVQQQNTSEEYRGFRRRADETMQRNYDLARNTMGVNAPETSVEAVRNVITGSTDNYDIDTVLTDNEAKKAVEKITGVKLSLNNAQARSELENIALTRQIQNRDKILQETHESIRTNMSQRGGDLFDNNYDNAVRTLDVPNGAEIYDSFFSRFYTDGTVKGADFENSYNRIMSNVREDFGDDLAGRIGEVFNRQFAQKVFAEGQMAQATYNAKYQGKALSMKASENPAGFTYEDTARAKISDRQAELLTKFAERANVHIRLVDSIANGSANGAYQDGVIMIAADSTNKLVTVAKHELTHHIRATSPELYQKLEDFVLQKWYDADADAMEAKIQEYQRRYNNRPEEAREELIADAAESFFTDAGSIQAVVSHDRSLAQAIHDGIKTLLDTFLDLQDSDNLSKRGYGDFLDDIGILRDAERMWLEALEDSRERSKGTTKGETTDRNINKLDKSGNVLTTKSGEPIAKFEKDGSAQFSLKTYEDDGRRIYRDYLNKMVKSGELKRAEADQMYNELETIYKITREYADSGKYVPFTAWSNAEVVIGENGKPVFSAIKANSEYKMNIDFSTICKKRRTLDNVFRVMVNRGLFEQLDLNKDESAALVVNINDLIREHGFEAACALCFVEARRYRQQQTATTFRDMWNGLVESMYKDKSKIEHFNYGKNESVREVPDGIHTMSDKDLDLSYVRKLATAKNDEGKLLQTAEAKAARLLLKDPSQRKLMLVGDMMASTGFENMQVKNPELMKIYNAKKGTGGAKSSFGDVQYLNEILKPRSFGRKKAYSVSGVRIQSFSDYVPRMVFDYVQVIADLAAKRLPAHGYTKEVLFALQFGLTGVKINMPLVPDVVADGVAPGLDKNGNYVWNKDGTFPWEDYEDKNGRKMPGARTIQKAKGYGENCGTIAVGISDEQIWKMLHDPEIQMVIPYHKSSLNPLVAAMTNVDRFTDYTDYQNTRDANGKAVEKDFDWDNKLFRLSHGKDGKLLPKSQWGNVQELVQEYVDWCNDHNYTPKFEQFLYEKDGTINPGYYKMLEDFALLDEEGNFKPQDDVKMNFPTEDSAFGSMASFIEQGLDEDTKLEKKRADEIEDIVDEIEGMIEDGSITKQSIFSEALAKKMTDADTKYQLKDLDATDTIASQNTIAKLEEKVADLKGEFKRTDLKTADPKQVRIQAGKLIKRHDSNMSIQGDLVDAFNKIFRLYKEKGTEALPETENIAKDAANMIVDNMYYIHEENKTAKEERESLKAYIRNNPIVVTEEMKRNIADFGNFYKRNFGRIKMKNGLKTNLDKYYYDNLAKEAPSFFKEGYTTPVDMLNHIEDFFDEYDNLYTNYEMSTEEMQDYVAEIAADILFTAYDLQTKKTFADKKYLEKEAAVKKARQKALESRDKALERQRTRYEKKIDDMKAHQKEIRENRKARREDSEARTKLLKIARRLDKLKTTAENRAQIDALIGDLDLVAKGMTDKSVENLTDLQNWYDDRAQNDPDFIPDSNIENKLKRLSKTHIKDMTIEEVRDLYDVLSNIENEIATEKKLIDSEVKKEIYEAGRETIKNINKFHGIANSIRKMDTFFVSGTLSPLRQIRRVTGYNDSDPLYIATKELADGQRKMLQYQMDSWKAFDRFMNDKKFIDSLNGKKAEEIEVTGMKDGEPFDVKITPDIRVAMYLAGMNEDNLRHMKYGGITLPDIKLYKKGKIAEAMESGETVRFSPSQIKEITSHMSKREKEFAQEAYKYYNITSPQAINEVSEVLKGYSLARVNNYFPIHTDSDFLTKEFESMKFDGTIEGMGFLKERVKASNPILMTGLVDTLTKSIEMNSKYVGLAIPVRNFSKILNVKDMSWDEEGNAEFRGAVKRSISKKWGKSVLNYIEKFMTDLQNGRKSSDEWGSVFSKARSRYAGAVLTLNASVAIKQAASYPTAAAVLGWAPLAKAMGNVGKVDLDLIAKYTPLQWYRSKGYSTTELGDITSSRTGNIPTPLNWIQGMDLLTTRKLWKASEYYVRQHNKSLKAGTDEYYKAVAEIYNKVIEETQPNYTTMQRPGLLRSDNEITLTLNMFKTQPYQNFNILYDAFGNYTAKRNQYKANGNSESKKALKEAGRDMQNAVTSQIAQLAVFAAMTSLWALFRRKDDKYRDEEGKLTFFSYMKKLGEDMVSNLFAAVPLGADVYSMASSIFTGDTYYGFTSVTDSAITDVMDSFKNGAVAIGDWIEYGRSDNPEKKPSSDMYKETENVISSASRAMGIPASNLRNLVNGIYGWVAISADGEYIGTYEAQKMTFAKGKEMKQNLFRAYQNDKAAYEELRKMMIEDGFDEAKLDDYIKDQRKEHPTEEEQKEIDSTMQELEGSNIWKTSSDKDKERYSGYLEKIALEIEDDQTDSITKYATDGLTNEQIVLFKLALRKADAQNNNNGGYDNDEKKAALKMLMQNYNFTEKQKKILMSIKS